jgi:hypothetical protein
MENGMDITVDNVFPDGPSSNPTQPSKALIRRYFRQFETAVDAGLSNGGLIYDTKANMDADLAHDANASAWVMTGADAGIYRKSGASGAGGWTRVASLPYSYIKAANVGAGAADAIQATTDIPVPAADGAALIALPIFADNTASPVTVAINGGPSLTVKTASGNDVAPGGLKAGMIVSGYVSGSTFRMLSDQASVAIQAAAEAAQVASENARDASASSADRAENYAAMLSADKIKFPTVAALQADTVMSYTSGAGKTQVGAGDIVEAERFPYTVEDAAATGDQQTAGDIKLTVLKLTTGEFNINQFSGAGVGAKFNAALAAAKDWAERPDYNSGWIGDTATIIIPSGVYAFDETLDISSGLSLTVKAAGAVIVDPDSDQTVLRLQGSRHINIENLGIDQTDNQNSPQAVLLAGQCARTHVNNLRVMANRAGSDGYAAVRMIQGTASGPTPDARDNGNFWTTFERFWCGRKSSSASGQMPVVFDLQGAQNATRFKSCDFGNFETGILVRNQNGSALSGAPNDLQIHMCAFEGFTGSAVKWIGEAATILMAGGSMGQCRFEGGGAVVEAVNMNPSPAIPFMLAGNMVVSSMGAYFADGTPLDQFNTLDAFWTPAVGPRIVSVGTTLIRRATGQGASLAIGSRGENVGGALALQRTDGVIDGTLSQAAGGGLAVRGGSSTSNLSLDLASLRSLSGTGTFAKNFRGFVSPTSNTTYAVTFGVAEPDANYRVLLSGEDQRALWVTGRTTAGFTINTDIAFAGKPITWILIR